MQEKPALRGQADANGRRVGNGGVAATVPARGNADAVALSICTVVRRLRPRASLFPRVLERIKTLGNTHALQDLPAFKTAVREAIDRVNKDLSVVEKVRQFAFVDEAFTIENEEMTPSMKIRRHKIKERYQERIDGLYRG